MDKVKLGIVGLNRGSAYLQNISHCKKAEITAVCDIDRTKADDRAKKYHIENVYYDLDEILKSDVDAVVMATPINLHTEHVLKALKAGKHVLSEVIVATTLDDCEKLARAVKTSGKKYMMAENYCYIRPLTIIKNMADAGVFGEIYYAESDYLKDFQEYNPNFPNIGGWRQPTYFGRRGHPYITHSLGPLMEIMGEKIASVTCVSAGHSFQMKADNTCVLLCRTENGNMVRLRNSFVSPRPDNVTYYSIQGTKGCYQAPQGPTDFHKVYLDGICKPNEWKNVYDFSEYLPAGWKDYFGDKNAADKNDNDTYALYDSGICMMIDAFADCIQNDKQPPVDFFDAVNWTATGLLSETSVENGCIPVEIPKF